jgi:hypothetical protein
MRMTFKSFLALAIIKFDLRGWGQCFPRWWRIGVPTLVANSVPMMVAEGR